MANRDLVDYVLNALQSNFPAPVAPTPARMRAAGFSIDGTSYPWRAWRRVNLQTEEVTPVYTDYETALRDKLIELLTYEGDAAIGAAFARLDKHADDIELEGTDESVEEAAQIRRAIAVLQGMLAQFNFLALSVCVAEMQPKPKDETGH